MRTWLCLLTTLSLSLAAPALAYEPAPGADVTRVMSVIEWLNHEVRQSDLVVLAQVQSNAYPNPQTGRVQAVVKVGEVFNGPQVPSMLMVQVKSGFRGSKYVLPTPLMKDQWALLFLRNEAGRWVAPPVGRVVETPYKGLTFYPTYNVVISDATPGLSWDYVLGSLRQLVATRKQIINGYMPSLRQATNQEQRDRILFNIEWQVKEQLGLPVP
ncbi:hypothetical protein D3C72_1483900 [compost metagenome]